MVRKINSRLLLVSGLLCSLLPTSGWALTRTSGSLLFYNTNTGSTVSGVLSSSDGRYQDLRQIPGINPNWTHIVSTGEGTLLFYSANTGLGASGYLDANGSYVQFRVISGFNLDWREIVAVP